MTFINPITNINPQNNTYFYAPINFPKIIRRRKADFIVEAIKKAFFGVRKGIKRIKQHPIKFPKYLNASINPSIYFKSYLSSFLKTQIRGSLDVLLKRRLQFKQRTWSSNFGDNENFDQYIEELNIVYYKSIIKFWFNSDVDFPTQPRRFYWNKKLACLENNFDRHRRRKEYLD